MTRLRRIAFVAMAIALAMAMMPVSASGAGCGNCTPEASFITLDPSVPNASFVQPIVSSGEFYFGERIPGIPDGIGLRSGAAPNTVEIYVAHEETHVPFRGTADLQDASVMKITVKKAPGQMISEILSVEVAIPSEDGFLRFCSAGMAGPAEGFVDDIFFANEETNDIVDVSPGVPTPDPGLDPGKRQGGFAVALNTSTGAYTTVPGMGRLNHEATVPIPHTTGIVAMTTDDTFSATTSQLYMYTAADQDAMFADEGTLWAFRVTEANGVAVKPRNPFNGANDYLDISLGDVFEGEFIKVPRAVALGTSTRFTATDPQGILEEWSNINNVFQFIRLEDVAYDKNDPSIFYVADTGGSRVVPDAATGRMMRGPSGTVGLADNGRMFKFVLDPVDPTKITHFSVMADGDGPSAVGFRAPDNIDTSVNSLMVQEDADNAAVWRYDFGTSTWSTVAWVNDPDGESSGIVDASAWFGPGTWILDVQGHGTWVNQVRGDNVGQPGVTLKRESGQVMLMRIPGS